MSSPGGGGGDHCHLCPSIGLISDNAERVNALYSPFRPREANPDSYDLKMKFWTKAIAEFVDFGGRFTFTLKDIQKGLMIHNKTPAGLQHVLHHLHGSGVVLAQSDFYDYMKCCGGWVAWSQVNVKRALTKLVPISWPFSSPSDQLIYVHVQHLKNLILEFDKIPNLKGNLISLSKFKELISSKTAVADPVEFQILVDYLKSTRCLVEDKVGPEDVVIYGPTTESITQVQKGKYDIRRVTEVLENDINRLETQMDISTKNAKDALKINRRATAKHELKRRKLAEGQRDKLINMVDTLHVIQMKIEDAETDAKILSAYESGKKALATTLKDNDLTVDRATETMLDIQDLLEAQGEISAAISASPMEEDLSELDEELELMLKEDEANEKAKQEEEALKLLDALRIGGALDELPEIGNTSARSLPSPSSVISEF